MQLPVRTICGGLHHELAVAVRSTRLDPSHDRSRRTRRCRRRHSADVVGERLLATRRRASHTAVSLESTRAPGGALNVFVQVTQEFCDSRTDHEVFRSFVAQGPARAFFGIDRNLHSASLVGFVTGHVVDDRLTSCSAPSGQPTTVDRGRAKVALVAHGPVPAPPRGATRYRREGRRLRPLVRPGHTENWTPRTHERRRTQAQHSLIPIRPRLGALIGARRR